MKGQEYKEKQLIKLKKILVNYTDLEIDEISMESRLMFDLGLTSFDFMCLTAAIEEETGAELRENQLEGLETVRNVYQLIIEMDGKL